MQITTRKELKREVAELRSKAASLDADILVKEAAGEDATEQKDAFNATMKRVAQVSESIVRKEALEDDDETKDADDSEDDEDKDADEDEGKSRKASRKSAVRKLAKPSIIRARSKLIRPIDRFGAVVIGKALSRLDGPQIAYETMMKAFGDEPVAKASVGSLTTDEPTIFQDASPDIIELMNGNSIVRAAGAKIEAMPFGNKTVVRQRLGGEAQYVGEGKAGNPSKIAFDAIQMRWHKMWTMSSVTFEELRFPTIDVAAYVVNDIVARLALKEDKIFLLSEGEPGIVPRGLLPQIKAANRIESTLDGGEVTWQTVVNDFASLESLLSGNFVQPGYVLFMHPNVGTRLKAITNGFDRPFADGLSKAEPEINGHRVFYSPQIPTNLGDDGDETLIFLVKPSHMRVGDKGDYDISMTTEGSFMDGDQLVNPFPEQKAAFLGTAYNDFALDHDVSAAVLTAKGWTMAAGRVAGRDRYDEQPASTEGSHASSARDRTPAPAWTTAAGPISGTFPDGSAITPVNLAATGAVAYAITSGTLPTGLSLNGATGVISGTPTTEGTSSFTVAAVSSAATTTTRTFSITVA